MNAKTPVPVPPPPRAISRSEMSPEDVNLLAEIDESLRAEKLAKLWKNFGGVIVGACVALLLATIGWVAWSNHVHVKKEEATALMLQASRLESEGKFSDAADVYVRVPDVMPSLATLARVREADALLGAGQNEKALTLLRSITGKPDGWTELAKLKALRLEQEKSADAKNAENLVNTVYPFTAKEWAALAHLEKNEAQKATEILSQLQADPEAPASIQTRARELLNFIHSRPQKTQP